MWFKGCFYCPQTKLWEGNVFTGICHGLAGFGRSKETLPTMSDLHNAIPHLAMPFLGLINKIFN